MKKSLKIGLIALIVLTILNTVAIIFIYSRANDAFDDLYKKRVVLVLLRTLKEFYLEGDTLITLVLCQ